MFFLAFAVLTSLNVLVVANNAAGSNGNDTTDEWYLQIVPPGPSGVLFHNEQGIVSVELSNASDRQKNAKLSVDCTFDLLSVDPISKSFEATVDGKSSAKRELSLPTEQLGYWQIIARVEADGAVLAEATSGIAIVDKPSSYGNNDPQSFFGAMFIGDFEVADRLGMKFDRVQAYWRFLTFEEGKYHWERLDRKIDAACRHGIGVVLTIRPEEIHGIRIKWARWKDARELATEEHLPAYRQFVRDVMERYGDRIAAVEFTNEPDLTLMKEHDFILEEGSRITWMLHREGYRLVKAIVPDMLVVGMDISGVEFRKGFEFTRSVLDRGTEELFDIFGGHPYSNMRLIADGKVSQWPKDYDLRGELIDALDLMKSYGLPRRAWPTELGWALDVNADPLSDAARRHAAVAARAIIEAKSVPGVEKLFWFAYHTSTIKDGYNYGLIREASPKYPLPAVNAYATAARMLHHTEPASAVNIAPTVRAWRFNSKDNDCTVVALWSEESDLQIITMDLECLEVFDMYGRNVSSGAEVVVAASREPVYYRVPRAEGDRLINRLQSSMLRRSSSE